MDTGLNSFALILQREVLAGKSPARQLNVDAKQMSRAFCGRGYVQHIVQAEVD